MRQLVLKAADIGHAHAVREVFKHRLVVARVTREYPLVQLLGQVALQQFAHDPVGALPFVEITKTAVDVDAADRCMHAIALQQVHHALHGGWGQSGELVVVKSQVGFAAIAVTRGHHAGHLKHHPGPNLLHAHLVGCAGNGVLLVYF